MLVTSHKPHLVMKMASQLAAVNAKSLTCAMLHISFAKLVVSSTQHLAMKTERRLTVRAAKNPICNLELKIQLRAWNAQTEDVS